MKLAKALDKAIDGVLLISLTAVTAPAYVNMYILNLGVRGALTMSELAKNRGGVFWKQSHKTQGP